MYRCAACRAISPPRQPRFTHLVMRTVYRKDFDGVKPIEVPRQEIAREVPVCKSCFAKIKLGCTLEQLIEYHRPKKPLATIVAEDILPAAPEPRVLHVVEPLRPLKLI